MLYIIVFIVGLLFGSFGSVILHRLGEHITKKKVKSVLVGRSHCPHCKHTLAWYDLFPLLSRLATGGKCRYCKTKVSHRYPLLELGSGLVFLGIFYWRTIYGGGDIGFLITFLFINRSLYLLMVHDIKTMYLHPVAWRMAILGSIILLIHQNSPEVIIGAAQRIFVFGIGFALFYRFAKIYVRLRRKQNAEGMGQGDVMLAPIVGLLLRKIISLMLGGTNFLRRDIIQSFWYYVIIACLSALLLLFITPVTNEEGKRLIPFFPGMIVGIWIMMAIWPWLIQLMS